MKQAAIRTLPAILFIFLSLPFASYASNMNNASYWIKKIKSPDEVLLNKDRIAELNAAILEKTDQMAEIGKVPETLPGDFLLVWLTYDAIPSQENIHRRRYDERGKVLGEEFFRKLKEEINTGDVKDTNQVRLGVVTQRADVRAFPTLTRIYRRPGDREFDAFQYSSIYPPEQVALLHTSTDGKWGFFQTKRMRGWIRLDNVAFGDRESIDLKADRFLVATGSHVKVYGDSGLKKILSVIPMGTVLYTGDDENSGNGPWVVKFPHRLSDGSLTWVNGYIDKKADMHDGFLPYTERNVITQAFKMLNEKYGWGGKDGRRDCSEFIKDIFETMGIELPRNSGQQRVAGDVKAEAEPSYDEEDGNKAVSRALMGARPGITLLGLDRHIMLYLGTNRGKPYAIHQVYGYVDGRKLKVINKVAVTGLDLGRRSRAGSLKDRIKSITEVLIPGQTL